MEPPIRPPFFDERGNQAPWMAQKRQPRGDFAKAPRCQCPAMANGRCRLHGGLSTGPKTAEGIERIRRAATKHGYYSKAAIEERRRGHAELRALREAIAALDTGWAVRDLGSGS